MFEVWFIDRITSTIQWKSKRIKDIRPPPIYKIDRGKKGQDVRGGNAHQCDDGSSAPLKKRDGKKKYVEKKSTDTLARR